MMIFDADHPLSPELNSALVARIDRCLMSHRAHLEALEGTSSHLTDLFNQAHRYATAGKGIRSALCLWSHLATSGELPDEGVWDVAASVDLLHGSALVHDDIIDRSMSRRGWPSAHRFFSETHQQRQWASDPDHFGLAAGIIVGDLLLAWSNSLFNNAHLLESSRSVARQFFVDVQTEVLAGQYLDLLSEARHLSTELVLTDARLIMEYKTARYTIARPAQIGAALAGATPDQLQALAVFGEHIGRAYQMRDDLLGVFGDPQLTGKPRGDDILLGKKTMLLGYALDSATKEQKSSLTTLWGNGDLSEHQVDLVCQILIDTGAVQRSEQVINEDKNQGLTILQSLEFTEVGLSGLKKLVDICVERES
ncbi:MAG: polyprenyl synthetase family protein [Propionibacteriaceae bacterium]|nr:polyprenyl synthetase family protein [Propionibacteriaceae bacterium]